MLTYSEQFFSLEGEARYTGTPTVYLRLTGCNKTCEGFNNPEGLKPTNEVLGYDPRKIKVLEDIPEVTRFCDSFYSWDERFSHLWTTATPEQIIQDLEALLPHNAWSHPKSGQNVIMSYTGGEPLQNQKNLPELINHPTLSKCKHILFETNGSVPIKQSLMDSLTTWVNEDATRKLTFSNSPKLSASGETWKSSVKPKAILTQFQIPRSEVYFKFVCDAKAEHFEEVYKAMEEYWAAGIPRTCEIYIMPMACTEQQQEDIAVQVADLCKEYGFIFCIRLQNILWKNIIGT